MEPVLRLGIQKEGRLSERSLEFIEACGIDYSRNKTRLKSTASNFPLEILYLRDDDIPKVVADGVADIGIVGENVVVEKQETVDIIERMGFSRCRLSIAVPANAPYLGPDSLNGKKIATSYPNLLREYLVGHGVLAEIHEISGSVEIAPSIGLADAICDIVSSGSTLMGNGLREAEVIFRSEAVLVGHRHLSPAKQEILNRLLFRIKAVSKAENHKYIVMNIPNEAIEEVTRLIPGMKSPTVTPLAEPGWSSLHSVLKEDTFWDVIEQLQAKGAQGILVIPIEKMIL
ncbi:MAG: ATP phosphoribosyltransferase [Bacteroidetes bacterium]|nr:MAG: ATP phosphoribosyltransferase [Bacteroidota bacterium]